MVSENLPITRVSTDDLEATIDTYLNELAVGYRLDMISPADNPSEAWLSNGTSVVCIRERRIPFQSKKGGIHRDAPPVIKSEWHTGRAGMEYRDLIPGRLDGKVIASHIRIPNGGEVADYVHYHKVDFQMIYCVSGAIRVVYEDQGLPFWLKPGDCVLQPPEIRHRVLEAEPNSEVVEIGSPAVHETWADHDLTLPTRRVVFDREFSGQRFLHYIAADSEWKRDEVTGFEASDTGMHAASNGIAEVNRLRPVAGNIWSPQGRTESILLFYFVPKGSLKVRSERLGEYELTAGDSVVLPTDIDYELQSPENSEILCVVI
jgi:quercetin dioxygenase-like cupin family protein